MVLVLALVEGVAAPVVVELVIVVKIGVRRVSRHGPRGDGGVSERVPRGGVITRKHFHATESASKLIPGCVSLPLYRSVSLLGSIGRLHRDCRRR